MKCFPNHEDDGLLWSAGVIRCGTGVFSVGRPHSRHPCQSRVSDVLGCDHPLSSSPHGISIVEVVYSFLVCHGRISYGIRAPRRVDSNPKSVIASTCLASTGQGREESRFKARAITSPKSEPSPLTVQEARREVTRFLQRCSDGSCGWTIRRPGSAPSFGLISKDHTDPQLILRVRCLIDTMQTRYPQIPKY